MENVDQIVAVSEELRRRNGLQIAISGLSFQQLASLIRLIRKNIVKSHLSRSLTCLVSTLLGISCFQIHLLICGVDSLASQDDMTSDPSVSDELVKLYNQVGDELEAQNLLSSLYGAVQICNLPATL